MGELRFKGFKKGLICRDKQYAENTVFEEPEAKISEKGMHYCKNPFDVLDNYDLVNEDGSFNDFAMVEPLSEEKTNDNKQFCTTKLKIGAKFSFSGFIEACVNFMIEKTGYAKSKESTDYYDAKIDGAKIGSSDYGARIGSSGDGAQIGSSGDGVKIGSSGNNARIGNSGEDAQIGSSGNYAKIGSSGESARIGSSGYGARIGNSGYYARIGSSGDGAQISSSGDCAQISSFGNCAQIGCSGDGAQISSFGDGVRISNSGDDAQIDSSGDYARIGSFGDGVLIDSIGKHSVVMCAGFGCKVKATISSFITLTEWKYDEEKKDYTLIHVKTEKVDGEHIKPDTYYELKNGEFVEAED